jgi:uncharacterized protein (DUF1778 family)
MAEIRGRVKQDYYELIKTVADFTGDTPFEFCLSAGLEKARELIVEKFEFDKVYAEAKMRQRETKQLSQSTF